MCQYSSHGHFFFVYMKELPTINRRTGNTGFPLSVFNLVVSVSLRFYLSMITTFFQHIVFRIIEVYLMQILLGIE